MEWPIQGSINGHKDCHCCHYWTPWTALLYNKWIIHGVINYRGGTKLDIMLSCDFCFLFHAREWTLIIICILLCTRRLYREETMDCNVPSWEKRLRVFIAKLEDILKRWIRSTKYNCVNIISYEIRRSGSNNPQSDENNEENYM